MDRSNARSKLINCVSLAVPGPSDAQWLARLEHARQDGFAAVELELAAPTAPQNTPNYSEQLTEIIEKTLGYGLGLSALRSKQWDLLSLADSDQNVRDAASAALSALLEYAATLRRQFGKLLAQTAPLLVVGAHDTRDVTASSVQSYEMAFNRVFAGVEDLTRQAERAGVILAIENPAAGLLLSPLELRRFIDELNSPHARLYFNVSYAERLGDPSDWLAIMGRRTLAVRLPDRHGLDAPVRRVLQTLERTNFAGWVTHSESA